MAIRWREKQKRIMTLKMANVIIALKQILYFDKNVI